MVAIILIIGIIYAVIMIKKQGAEVPVQERYESGLGGFTEKELKGILKNIKNTKR